MGIVEIVVIIFAVLIVSGVVGSIVIAKKKGKPSLLDDCASCPHAKVCSGKCLGCHCAEKSKTKSDAIKDNCI